MNVIVGTVVWGLLSVGVSIAMAAITNERSEEKKLYTWEKKTASMLMGCLIVSLVAGYTAAVKSSSVPAWIVLSISYMAVLGASVIDYKLQVIPNAIPCFLLVGKLLVILFELCCMEEVKWDILSSLAGFAVCFAVLMIAGRFTRGGIGKGDVKLLASLGFACGVYMTFVTLTIALLYCAAVSLMLVFTKKLSWKDHLPFAPFIFMGYLSMIYYI